MTATAKELGEQCRFLGMPLDLLYDVQEKPDILKRHMIRHTKSQQINGSTALALLNLGSPPKEAGQDEN